jgi:hypothetical protein
MVRAIEPNVLPVGTEAKGDGRKDDKERVAVVFGTKTGQKAKGQVKCYYKISKAI